MGFESWVGWLARRYRSVLALSLLVVLGCALSLLRLRLDLDVLDMLPKGAPAFDDFKRFVADFGELDELVVLIEGDDPTGVESFADDLVERVTLLDSVSRVQGRIDPEPIQDGLLGRYLFHYLPLADYEELERRLTPAGIDAQVAGLRSALAAPMDLAAAAWVRRDPLGITRQAATALAQGVRDTSFRVAGGYLSTEDGTALLLFVRPRATAFDGEFTARFMQQMRDAEGAVRAANPASTAIRVGYTGSYAFAVEDAATIEADIKTYVVLALLGVLATFGLGYRSLRILPFVTYPLVISTVVTFAAGLLIYDQLNAVSLCFAAILYGLSIDSGIHYYTRLLQELDGRGLSGAVHRTLRVLAYPNLVATTTTAAAFLVIGFSGIVGVSQLGILTALGMLVTMVEFFVIYPALTFAMGERTFVPRSLATPRLGRLAGAAARHARWVCMGLGFATILAAWGALDVRLDADLMHLRPTDTAAMRVQDRVAECFAANASAGAVLLTDANLETALQGAEELAPTLDRYREEGLLLSARGVAGLLPSRRRQQERLAALDRLPRLDVATWLRAALPRHGFQAGAFDDFLNTFVNPARDVLDVDSPALQPLRGLLDRYVRVHENAATVAIYLEPAPGIALRTVAERLHRDAPSLGFVVAGRSLLQEELGAMLRRELVGFCVLSFLLNLALVVWFFRHAGVAIAILFPQLLAILACLAAMRASGVAIDPVNLILIPITLGIGVDNCVYVAERWQRGEAWQPAVQRSGRALAISALTTMAGFGFLGLSEYPTLATMGIFSALSLAICLVLSLTALPALMTLLGPAPRPASNRP